ncbi:MAG: hypothetical protein MUE42_15780 [Opitutaceae bacterium]|jgi:hypothetical protein|nr:hypothetical protein [Opitutaceae bacterium]
MKRLLTCIAASLLLLACPLQAASPEAEAVIAKARAHLGGDAALDAVRSIRYSGSIEMTETPAATPARSRIEIIFQKPCQHRLVITSDKTTDITGLDDYLAWRRIVPLDGGRAQTIGMGADATQRLRANTWENLSFFRGIEQRGGEIVDQGEAEIDGIRCRKLVFSYGSGIEFIRYIDLATGRLVLTETLPVGRIREEGEIVISGLRFPKKLIATGPASADGRSRVITITFDRIVLNETFPASTFEQPVGRTQ